MDARTFLNNFATVAEAPGGVQRLRDLVLELAFRGMLTTADFQALPDPISGPASRASATAPFEIPGHWAWHRLDEIADYNKRPKVSPNTIPETAWSLDLEDIEKSTSALIRLVSASERPSKSTKCAFERGDVLYGKLRPYLDKVLVAGSKGYCTTEIVPIVPRTGIDSHYLRWSLKRPDFRRSVESASYGMKMPRLGTKDALASLHPVPPLAEQERIVAKVDELMGLCDDIDARQNRRHQATTRFRGSALHALVETATSEQVRHAWKRVESNWQTLTAEPDAIDELRRTILQLAVTGNLSDNNEGVDRARSAQPTVDEISGEFPLPAGWAWREFGQLCEQITVGHVGPMSNRYVPFGIPFLRSQNVDWFRYDPANLKYIDSDFHSELQKSALLGGEVISVRSGNVGRTCVFPEGQGPANCADLVIMRVGPQLNPHYAAIVMNSPYGIAHVSSKKVGIAQAHFNVGSAKRMPTPVPPIEVQSDLVQLVQQLLRACDELESSVRLQRRRAELLAAATPRMAGASN